MLTDGLFNSDMIYSATIVVGLVLGSLAVLSTLFVFVRRSKLGMDGVVLSCFGSFLISLSLWQSVNVKVAGAEMKLERVKQTVEAIKPAIDQAAKLTQKMEEWSKQDDQSKLQTQVKILTEQWKVVSDLNSSLSKDLNDMTEASIRNLR